MGPGGPRQPSVGPVAPDPQPGGALFGPEFARLARTGNLRVHALVGRRSEASQWWGGADKVDPVDELRQLVPDLPDREVFLCGPFRG